MEGIPISHIIPKIIVELFFLSKMLNTLTFFMSIYRCVKFCLEESQTLLKTLPPSTKDIADIVGV